MTHRGGNTYVTAMIYYLAICYLSQLGSMVHMHKQDGAWDRTDWLLALLVWLGSPLILPMALGYWVRKAAVGA